MQETHDMEESLWDDLLALLGPLDGSDASSLRSAGEQCMLGDFAVSDWSPRGAALNASHIASEGGSATSAATPSAPMLLQDEQPSLSASEMRRMKNREFMRGARRRRREELQRMKAMVESLEKKCAELCLRSGGDNSRPRPVPPSPTSPSSALAAPRRSVPQSSDARRLHAQAVEMVKQLGVENLLLRAAVRDKIAWRTQLQSTLGSLSGTRSSTHANPPLGSPHNTPPHMGYLPLDVMDPDAARAIFGFTPLTEEGVTALILDNSHQMNSVRTQLESLQRVGDSRLLSRQVFGWDVVQRVTRNSIMEYMITKRFSGLSARDIMHRTWANDMELEKFRKVKCDVKRLEVLQEANANAYILGRDVRAPDNSTVFRSVYLRYLIETTQVLPNPRRSVSDEMDAPPLKATGFILGTHSANRDWSQSGHASLNVPKLPDCDLLGIDDHEKLVWADIAMSIEFLDVEDPETGETYQRARWMGRTDYKSPADALRNTADILSGCLRWEMLMISPALNLISLDLS